MKLKCVTDEGTLFAVGEVFEAEIIPSAGTGRAVLVAQRGTRGLAQWISPGQAKKEGLGILEASPAELGMLRGSGYRLAVEAPERPVTKGK